MELTDLGYFRHVALAGSFAEAARRAHVSGPAVSKAIKRLEQALEVPLFERTTRSVRLTDAGRLVLEHTERIFGAVSGLEQALDETHGVFRGPYRVALPEVLDAKSVATAITGLSALQPGMRPRLSWLSGSAAERDLREGQLDAAVRVGSAKSENLECQSIGVLRAVVVCAHDHALASAGRLERDDLEAHPFVVTIDPETDEPLDGFPRDAARRTIGASVQRLSVAIELACSGGMLGLFPETAIRERIEREELVVLDPGFEAELELYAVSRDVSPIFQQWCGQLRDVLVPEALGNVERLPIKRAAGSFRDAFAPSAE